MKVLVFGWEFPPHISGGLGTASYGLTKALSSLGVDIIFVVPRLFGDEDQNIAKLIGANNIPVRILRTIPVKEIDRFSVKEISEPIKTTENIWLFDREISEHIKKIEINSPLLAYSTPETFEEYLRLLGIDSKDIRMDSGGQIIYSSDKEINLAQIKHKDVVDLMQEVKFNFQGGYGTNLFQEVINYALVAREIAANNEFDLIHAHDWLTYLAGVEAKKISGRPLVIHVHATEFDRSGENINQQVYNIEKYGMENADFIIAVSNWTRNIIIKRYGIPAEKVFTVYNAVDHLPDMPHNYQKTVPEKIVTFLGRITFQKGPEYFIEAAKLVLDHYQNVRFVMAGSGDMLWRMIRLAASRRISDRLHFTGFLKGDDVVRLFNISDVYVMPSVSEPFGISPLEAMRYNVPVIISRQSGVAEVLRHAIKLDFWDTHAIADAIFGLVKYESMAQMFRKYARQELEQLKWENSARKVIEIYNRALQKFLS